MWVYVAVWEVQTGEVRQLGVGDTLEHLGVRATFWTLEPSDEAEGVTQLPFPNPSGDPSPHHRVVGTVAWVREPQAIHITVSRDAAALLPLLERVNIDRP